MVERGKARDCGFQSQLSYQLSDLGKPPALIPGPYFSFYKME